ncbi:venom peptide SjAPI-2 [Vespula pensylvanica]|uniref:venom peptide SjAPI-2 n=1 Tax=Vespula pensylvanica TaxID=30213 RepID=UPI001CBA1D6C|nr:venom peptide SjAPI-2 [Vespula pensylvanica]
MSRISMIIFVLALCLASIVYTSACGSNAIYTDCASPCALTCKNYQNPPKLCPRICIKGCKCINGYIFNNNSDCVLPSEC